MAISADIQRAFAEGGAKVVITRGLRKLVRPACTIGTLVFVERDLGQPFPELLRVPGIIPREAAIEDVHLFENQELFLSRFHQGHRCFVGIEERTGKLTNYRWVSTSTALIPELDRYLILKPGEAYVYDLHTLPEFRRRGIDAYTRHYTYSFLRDAGYKRTLGYIHGDNQPSLEAARRLLMPIGRVCYMRFRGCPLLVLGGSGPRFPVLRRL
jgi:GNAT superfamily N-acetyltransferase